MMTPLELRTQADTLLRNCSHSERQRSECGPWPDGATVLVCCDCWNQSCRMRKQARKLELDARPKDCDRCGLRPHRCIYAGYKLCGRCKTATEREHNQGLAQAGVFAICATGLLVDTSHWAGRQARAANLANLPKGA